MQRRVCDWCRDAFYTFYDVIYSVRCREQCILQMMSIVHGMINVAALLFSSTCGIWYPDLCLSVQFCASLNCSFCIFWFSFSEVLELRMLTSNRRFAATFVVSHCIRPKKLVGFNGRDGKRKAPFQCWGSGHFICRFSRPWIALCMFVPSSLAGLLIPRIIWTGAKLRAGVNQVKSSALGPSRWESTLLVGHVWSSSSSN